MREKLREPTIWKCFKTFDFSPLFHRLLFFHTENMELSKMHWAIHVWCLSICLEMVPQSITSIYVCCMLYVQYRNFSEVQMGQMSCFIIYWTTLKESSVGSSSIRWKLKSSWRKSNEFCCTFEVVQNGFRSQHISSFENNVLVQIAYSFEIEGNWYIVSE